MGLFISLWVVVDDRAAAAADRDQLFGGEHSDGPVSGARGHVMAGAELLDGG